MTELEPGPTRRVRIGGAVVNLLAYSDDGDTLTPLTVQPVQLSATELEHFELGPLIEQLQSQIDSAGKLNRAGADAYGAGLST